MAAASRAGCSVSCPSLRSLGSQLANALAQSFSYFRHVASLIMVRHANALKQSKARSASLRKVKRRAWSIASSARHLDRARLHPPESSAGHALAEPACSSGEAQSCTSTDSSSRSMRRQHRATKEHGGEEDATVAPELKQYQHRRECTAQQRLEEGQKVQQPIVLCSGVQVLFYRPAMVWFAPSALVPPDSRAESR